MRMTFSQPSEYLIILTPLDREAKAWLHTQWLDGDPVPRHLPPCVAEVVMTGFMAAGGVLVPH